MTAIVINAGNWRFYPQYMRAQNMHNGNWVCITQKENGSFHMAGFNVPMHHMTELGQWLCKWIDGDTK